MTNIFVQPGAPPKSETALAVVAAKYSDGVTLYINGEATATTKHYKISSGLSLAAGNRVVLQKMSGTYIVTAKI